MADGASRGGRCLLVHTNSRGTTCGQTAPSLPLAGKLARLVDRAIEEHREVLGYVEHLGFRFKRTNHMKDGDPYLTEALELTRSKQRGIVWFDS